MSESVANIGKAGDTCAGATIGWEKVKLQHKMRDLNDSLPFNPFIPPLN